MHILKIEILTDFLLFILKDGDHAGSTQLAKETYKRNLVNVQARKSRLLQVLKYELQPTHSNSAWKGIFTHLSVGYNFLSRD